MDKPMYLPARAPEQEWERTMKRQLSLDLINALWWLDGCKFDPDTRTFSHEAGCLKMVYTSGEPPMRRIEIDTWGG